MSERAAPHPFRTWADYWDAFFERNPAQRVKRDLVVAYTRTASPDAQRFLALRYGRFFGERRDFSMKECAAALKVPQEQLLEIQKEMLSEVLPELFRSPEFKEHRPVVSPVAPPDEPPRVK